MYADIGIYQINLAAVVMPLSYMHRLGVPRDLTKLLRLRQRKNDLNRQISVMKQEDLKPSNQGGILGMILVFGNAGNALYIYIYIILYTGIGCLEKYLKLYGLYVRDVFSYPMQVRSPMLVLPLPMTMLTRSQLTS